MLLSKVYILLDIAPELFFSESVRLVMVENVPKPPEVLMLFSQKVTSVDLSRKTFVVVIATKTKVKGQAGDVVAQHFL